MLSERRHPSVADTLSGKRHYCNPRLSPSSQLAGLLCLGAFDVRIAVRAALLHRTTPVASSRLLHVLLPYVVLCSLLQTQPQHIHGDSTVWDRFPGASQVGPRYPTGLAYQGMVDRKSVV